MIVVKPTGNPWKPSTENIATVPIPFPIVVTSIEGPFTERDRKLWQFLVHVVWHEMDIYSDQNHKLSVKRINHLFRECGGDHNSKWIWESAKRLMGTIVEWKETRDDIRYKNIVSLLAFASVPEKATDYDIIKFRFPPELIPVIETPIRFVRVRTHFMMGLSGKYAIILYEILESVANQKIPVLKFTVTKLREWLTIPVGKFTTYGKLKQCILDPAIQQINNNPDGAGFTVIMEPIKKGRAVVELHFTVTKTAKRIADEAQMIKIENLISIMKSPDLLEFQVPELTNRAIETARTEIPQLDIANMVIQWSDGVKKKKEVIKNPTAHFLAFCRAKAKQHGYL